MKSIFETISFQKKQDLPFVLYRKPNSETIFGLLQNNDTLHEVVDFTEKGFVFASFDGLKNFYIPENESDTWSAKFQSFEPHFTPKKTDFFDPRAKEHFLNLVAKAVQAIENNEFKKVVVSRSETVELSDFDLATAFSTLVQLYPTAFVYCFHHPKIGTWLGATPEQLLKANSMNFETMALAGTQQVKETKEVVWTKKEIQEQQFVTDYIVSQLDQLSSSIQVSEALSVKAGNLWHIKTLISGVFSKELDLKKAIQLLHPTPAVCGLPKATSKTFILENESYNRRFYTGFLGELNRNFASDLFVNLRCMQIEQNQARLYMGCGITKDSIPENEWNESVNKSMTMKRIL